MYNTVSQYTIQWAVGQYTYTVQCSGSVGEDTGTYSTEGQYTYTVQRDSIHVHACTVQWVSVHALHLHVYIPCSSVGQYIPPVQ